MANTTQETKLRRVFDDLERKFEGLVAKNLPPRGRILFVSSTLGNDNNDGSSPWSAFATVGKALSLVQSAEDTASQFQKDTTIFLLPQHAETISAASALSSNTVTGLYMGVAGTKIIGLGEGTQRPKFTFTTSTAADIEVAAADCRIENVVLESDVDSQVTAVTVAATADRSVFKDIELAIATITATAAPIDWFTVAAGASDLTFDGLVANYTETGTDSIVTTAANRGLKFVNCDIDVTFDAGTGALDATGILTDSEFLNNRIRSGDTAFSLAAGTILYTDFGTPDGDAWNYFSVTADMTSATWNTAAAHEIATVSGAARVSILPVCTTALEEADDGTNGTIELGVAGDTATLIAQSTLTAIDAGEFWLGTTPATSGAKTSVVDEIINNVDIGYTLSEELDLGALVFHVWSKPLLGAGSVVGVGAGGAFS